MLDIQIVTIPHEAQRYPTVGDWDWNGQKLTIRVSDMGNWKYEAAVALHELAECLLCKHEGVFQDVVDDFDKQYEESRIEGDVSEPGDHQLAPYRDQHFVATTLERIFAFELGIDWSDYEETVNSL